MTTQLPGLLLVEVIKGLCTQPSLILLTCFLLLFQLVNGAFIAPPGGGDWDVHIFKTSETYYNKFLSVLEGRLYICHLPALNTTQNVTCNDNESLAIVNNPKSLLLFTKKKNSTFFLESQNWNSQGSALEGSYPDLHSALKRFHLENTTTLPRQSPDGGISWPWIVSPFVLAAIGGLIFFFAKWWRSKKKKKGNPPSDPQNPEETPMNIIPSEENVVIAQ